MLFCLEFDVEFKLIHELVAWMVLLIHCQSKYLPLIIFLFLLYIQSYNEDWEKRVDNMDSTGEYKEYQIRALSECIETCSWEDSKADFIGNAFEEQMEAFNNDGALKPKNMCLSCFEKLPEEIWKLTTKTTSPTTTTVTPEPTTDKIAATTNAPTTVTATTASGAFTITDDGRS